jgi:putative phosphoesterase
MISDGDGLLFCGDFCAPFSLKQIAEGFSKPVHVVWGNNDGDKMMMMRVIRDFTHVILHGEFGELALGGRKIAVTHYPRIASPLAGSGEYDAVFYGHDHTANAAQRGATLLLNPGEVMGKEGRSTFAWYDTELGSGEIVTVD